ncbi:MAG: CBS domain-containing protein [Parcubacteria group bacterium]|jgi:CBS domain-containing protein
MKVADIMTKDVVTVEPETKITEVAETLFRNRFHGVPVVRHRKIIGIITETDFFTKDSVNLFLPSYIAFLKENRTIGELSGERKEKVEKLLNAKAKDIMSEKCVSILQDMDVASLLEFFKTTKFTTLPVINESDSLVGIVTLADILNLIRV